MMRMPQRRMKRARQFRPGSLQLIAMRQGQFAQHRAPGGRQPDEHFAFVLGAGVPGNGAFAFQAIHQFDGAVMLDVKTRGHFSNRRPDAFGKAVNREQQLMLLRFQPAFLGDGFAEVKKLADLAAKLRQIAILVVGKVLSSAHIYIVSRYNSPDAAVAAGTAPADPPGRAQNDRIFS